MPLTSTSNDQMREAAVTRQMVNKQFMHEALSALTQEQALLMLQYFLAISPRYEAIVTRIYDYIRPRVGNPTSNAFLKFALAKVSLNINELRSALGDREFNWSTPQTGMAGKVRAIDVRSYPRDWLESDPAPPKPMRGGFLDKPASKSTASASATSTASQSATSTARKGLKGGFFKPAPTTTRKGLKGGFFQS